MLKENIESKIYDLIIIGAGPAGCAAAVYAARKKINTLMILKDWGGQSMVSLDVQNWIGTPHITGNDLAKNLKAHVLEYQDEDFQIQANISVKNISKSLKYFEIETELIGAENNLNNLQKIFTHNILITTGSSRRKLNVPGSDIFEYKGLTYCATCDGPLFADMDVVVIGGGNAGFESATQLLSYCKSVTLLTQNKSRAEAITIKKISANPKFKLIENVILKEICGDKFVTSIIYTNQETNLDTTLNCSGIFVEIGQIPATDFIKDICELNAIGKIKVDPYTQQTSTKGIWAAGDCTNVWYHQNNIAVGDAIKAIENIFHSLRI